MDERETKVGVLDKAMAILRTFTRGETTLSPLEIAAHTNLPVPTIYRLAQALSEHGMLEREGQSYRLGLTLMHLGALVTEGIDLRRQTFPHLKWLNEHTGENAELHIRRGEARVAIEAVRSMQNLRPIVDIGAPMPLHLGASGKVLLAWLSLEQRTALVQASAARFAGNRPFDLPALQAQLEQVRADGWAWSDGERTPGAASIAAPVFDTTGTVVGAIALVAPSVRLSVKQRHKYMPLVREAAVRASSSIGYRLEAGQQSPERLAQEEYLA